MHLGLPPQVNFIFHSTLRDPATASARYNNQHNHQHQPCRTYHQRQKEQKSTFDTNSTITNGRVICLHSISHILLLLISLLSTARYQLSCMLTSPFKNACNPCYTSEFENAQLHFVFLNIQHEMFLRVRYAFVDSKARIRQLSS